MLKEAVLIFGVTVVASAEWTVNCGQYECLNYTVNASTWMYEIRDYHEGLTRAQILSDNITAVIEYFNGHNAAGAQISHTRPITSTFSVVDETIGEVLRVGMPLLSDFQPEPTNPDVAIVRFPPARLYAARMFGRRYTVRKMQRKLNLLIDSLPEDASYDTSKVILSEYNAYYREILLLGNTM